LLAAACIASPALIRAKPVAPRSKATFSRSILQAVQAISATQLGRGYLRSSSFSRDLQFSGTKLAAKSPPYTMCVGAVFEVIVTALNMYVQQSGDSTPHLFLPVASWTRLRPFDLRGQIWLVERSECFGTAHALQKFGMGAQTDFASLEPGAFINLNRSNRTGHATVFLSYIDKEGRELGLHSDRVAGFKYFSSQGTQDSGGFGIRLAFFSDAGCPTLTGSQKRDCGVIRSNEPMLLNCGVMWHPRDWEKGKALEQLGREAYHMQRGDTADLMDGDYDSRYLNGRTIDD